MTSDYQIINDYKSIFVEHYNNSTTKKGGRKNYSVTKIFSDLESLAKEECDNKIIDNFLPEMMKLDPFMKSNISFLSTVLEYVKNIDFSLRESYFIDVTDFISKKVQMYYNNIGIILKNNPNQELKERFQSQTLTFKDARNLHMDTFAFKDYKDDIECIAKKYY